MSRNNGIDRRQMLKLAGFSAAGLGLTAAGCGSGGSGSGGPVTIRHSWWGADDRAKKIQQCVTLFEKKHPKIKVKTDFQQYPDFWKKFNTQAAGGNPPDVIQNAVTFLRKYEAKNVLLDLSPQVEKGNLSLDGFRAGLEKFADIDGKLLGVPVGSNSMALVIDQAVYEKAGITPETGWTWDEWYAGMEKIRDGQKVAGDVGPHGVMYLYDLILRQNGKAFFTEDGMGFGEAELLPYWTEALARVKSGIYADPKKVEQIKPASALARGMASGEFTWDNFSIRYSAEGKSRYGLAPIPSTDGKRTGQYLGSLMLSGSARTKHPAEVATFIGFMTHEPEVARIMGYDRGVPATTAQFEAYRPTDAPSKAIEAYETAIAEAGVLEPITPHPAGADVIEAAFLRIAGDLSLGKASPKDSVKQFFSEAKTALGSN
ncbi:MULTISPECIES: ABC transporter substrate-binding protein [Streptomyces]|uniref:Multiple sugar transport system substrate-binding protein n=1 Tax=Streptomyces clavifer TaxID=68188 RepID=A0ABS4VEX7_9ACTN|nr:MULTISPECIES: extracellular solute-binding protein [Streptomyces]KQX89730.1 ABC transporter substrate-binding protein [Streptomyces sp. Root1319]KQZ20579.1 ABC transporter substrate-binding protein [Streptomyces sp. Root55]MBP2362478.1 multiple sugar transport system substrate-binding protein [Streptomyces clavifer]MDX2745325.1 extracellular solute-binding protein [Streptomyces sp. NRRL_B-2557]MDX3061684.1 extracellular solute-binding protein [Streptomyces sp. ND04-05B]